MNRRTNLILLSVTFCTALSAGWAAAPTPAWSPDAAMLPRLAPVVTIGSYQMQPPIGYVPETHPGPGGSAAHSWLGKARDDGTRHYVMLTTMTPPDSDTTTYTLDQVAAKMVAGVQKKRTDWKQTTPETGTVNGVTFVRTYWRGTDTASGALMYGFSYVAADGKGFLQLSSQDVETYWKTTMPLAEASALTFKKVDAGAPKGVSTQAAQ